MFQDTSLDMYLKLARRYPVMTKEQEQEMFAKYKKGGVFGELARQEFLLRNIRLVISIAKRVRVKDSSLEDRVQEGIFGLMRALEKFDGERGYKFSTYATWWVRQSILKSIQHTIRLPPYVMTASNQIRKMEQEAGRSFTDEECAEMLDLSVDVIQNARHTPHSVNILDLVNEDSGELRFSFADERYGADPSDRFILAEQVGELLMSNPSSLVSDRDIAITAEWYAEDVSLSDIARRYDMSRERVRQIVGRTTRAVQRAL